MSEILSDRQLAILNFLKSEIRKKGYPPSIREICANVGPSSTSTVHSHLVALERLGYIRRDPSKNRSIEILDKDPSRAREFIHVPVLGTVTAGAPILAVENIEETFPIPLDFVNNDTVFMLRIKGDSMIGAGIYNRDLVLVRQQNYAENNDIVVALLDDSVTVKRYFQDKNFVRLQSENPAYTPILSRNVTIVGKVIGLYRKF